MQTMQQRLKVSIFGASNILALVVGGFWFCTTVAAKESFDEMAKHDDDVSALQMRANSSRNQLSSTSGAKVGKFTFVNKCPNDVDLVDWSTTIPAGTTKSITSKRPKTSTRISWKYTKPANTWNFIELNANWAGVGESLTGHPSFSQYEGWSTSARYEALMIDTGKPCGADYGAEVRFNAQSAQKQGICKASPDDGSCQASTIASCFQCVPVVGGSGSCPPQNGPQPVCPSGTNGGWCRYLFDNSFALSYDGKTGQKAADHDFKSGPTSNTYVQFWCASIAGLPGVASLVDCLNAGKEFELRVTACSSGDGHVTAAAGKGLDVKPRPGNFNPFGMVLNGMRAMLKFLGNLLGFR